LECVIFAALPTCLPSFCAWFSAHERHDIAAGHGSVAL
jgi:hypothetical protein